MEINQRLFDEFQKKAKDVTVSRLVMGLGYSAVLLSDGGLGLAYTAFESKKTCAILVDYDNPEGKPASFLLEKIHSDIPLQRTMALAAVNALNYNDVKNLPEDADNLALLKYLNIGEGTRVAMVGAFKPVIKLIKEQGGSVEVYDVGKGLGDRERFYGKLEQWAEVLIMTSTSLLTNTTEEVLQQVGKDVRIILLGPTTPLIKAPFAHLPIHFLGGTVPVDTQATIRAVCHGTGTPVIQKFGRKVTIRM